MLSLDEKIRKGTTKKIKRHKRDCIKHLVKKTKTFNKDEYVPLFSDTSKRDCGFPN
jgi:hypothetical protein